MPHHNGLCYEFGPYRLDLSRRVLTRADETISLPPKATEVLVLLVTNAGQLLEKNELLKEVWPDTFVEESNLSQNIFILRRALGDERAGPRYIETVTRRGYRFIAAVRAVEAAVSAETEALAADLTSRPIVAVVPFLNVTSDDQLEYLADGLTDNIINNLSRVSKLRVMSRSAVFRHKRNEVDPQVIGKELGATAVLLGKLSSRPAGIAISVELVAAATGWLLWGESFDCEGKDILEIQDVITRQLLASLKLQLSDDEEKHITARYTENAEAYQAYLEGRYHWSRYTRKGIEKAIGHFRRAIELDPNYALAYAGIVDCYLRLATNYLPPEDDVPRPEAEAAYQPEADESDLRVKLRFEWDWKGAERELRRANELKTNYPSAHQWYAAYQLSAELFRHSLKKHELSKETMPSMVKFKQLHLVTLSPNEEVQVLCAIAREQIEVGNYEAARLMLNKWWAPGNWPILNALNSHSAADLLSTTGSLADCLSSTGHLPKGHKYAEALLSASIGIFEHLGIKRRSAEAKIELALSYYRQGMFELTRETLIAVLREFQPHDNDLRALALIRLGVAERHAGHVSDSLSCLSEASEAVKQTGLLVTGRYHHELAAALKELIATRSDYLEKVMKHFQQAFCEFVAIGHHRYCAVVENNLGLLLLNLQRFDEAEDHLQRARRLFDALVDKIRRAQVDDTLAQLYLATKRYDLALRSAEGAVASLELNDEEALLAEGLTTKGTILCKLSRYSEARGVLEGACRVAERCGDSEGAGRALLILAEEMYDQMEESTRQDIALRLKELLQHTQHASTRSRLDQYLRRVLALA
jgi:DNA-binding winged helix-turn-helix (wHTH) protein